MFLIYSCGNCGNEQIHFYPAPCERCGADLVYVPLDYRPYRWDNKVLRDESVSYFYAGCVD